MKEYDCTINFWDYFVEICARINNMTAKQIFQMYGYKAHTQLNEDEGDVSNLCWFKWCNWCYFCDIIQELPLNK